jgi:hypothetical protein
MAIAFGQSFLWTFIPSFMVTNPKTESPGIGLQQVESCSLIYLVLYKHVIIATQYLFMDVCISVGPERFILLLKIIKVLLFLGGIVFQLLIVY